MNLDINNNISKYKCFVCNEEFGKRHYYQNHLLKNHKINVRLKDFESNSKKFEIKNNEEIERRVNKIINNIKKSSIIFDVGSGKGSFTEKLLKLRPKSIYHLFEPVKNLYDSTEKKFENDKNVFINNFGLSNYNEKKSISKSYGNKHFGVNTYLNNIKLSNIVEENTITITLDQYCKYNKIKDIDFVKINTDGYEANVLEGFLKILNTFEKKPFILIKLKWGSNHPNWNYCKNIFNEIIEIGYFNKTFDRVKADSYILFEPLKL